MTELEQIQNDGANAFALRALGKIDKPKQNPFYLEENMPAQTGESTKAWSDKADAWEIGWEMEKAVRESRHP